MRYCNALFLSHFVSFSFCKRRTSVKFYMHSMNRNGRYADVNSVIQYTAYYVCMCVRVSMCARSNWVEQHKFFSIAWSILRGCCICRESKVPCLRNETDRKFSTEYAASLLRALSENLLVPPASNTKGFNITRGL